jgi:hypothetical protein
MRYTTWIYIGIVLLLVGEGILIYSNFISIDQTIETIGKGLVVVGAVISVGAILPAMSPC